MYLLPMKNDHEVNLNNMTDQLNYFVINIIIAKMNTYNITINLFSN